MGLDQVIYTTIERTAQIDNSVMPLINESGGTLDQGAVCVIDTVNAESFVTTTTQGLVAVKILLSRTVDGAAGLLVTVGKAKVLVQGNVAIGDRLVTCTTAGRAESNGAGGSGFATALTAYTGGDAGDVEVSLEQTMSVEGDAGELLYTPANNDDWGGSDPGEVDDALDYLAGKAPEGTAVKSTGVTGTVKYLRVDGDGTSSWQTPTPEGTAIKSTGVTGTVKYLRVDGDGTSSWQVPAMTADSTKAWVNFNGTGTVSIRDCFNVSSITDYGTGDYRVNFSTAMINAYFSTAGSCQAANGATFQLYGSQTASNVRVLTRQNNVYYDVSVVNVVIVGD